MNKLGKPCASCPWRCDATAADIPNFDMELAEKLSATCPDSKGMGPDFGASVFACHQSKPGEEFACVGWLATVGRCHPNVRAAVSLKRLDAASLEPGDDWPALHENYQQVLEKLRTTCGGEFQAWGIASTPPRLATRTSHKSQLTD